MNITFGSLDQLNRWESFQFLFDALALSDLEDMSELYNAKLAVFETSFNAFDEALMQERKVAPEQLIKAEEGRDLAIRKIYSLIREYAVFPYDPAKEDAANILLNFFKQFGSGSDIARLPQGEETALLVNFFQEIDKSEPIEQAFSTLGLTGALNELRNNNSTFIEMQRKRVQDDGLFVSGVVKTARTEAQNEFVAFTQMVNALALVEGPEKYVDLKRDINTLHKNTLDRFKQRTKKKEEEEETVPEETEQNNN